MPARTPEEALDGFGRLIRRARMKRRWSQRRLATESNIAQADISALESGGREVNATHMLRLGKALDLELSELSEAAVARAKSKKKSHRVPRDVYGTMEPDIADSGSPDVSEGTGSATEAA